MEKDDRVVEIYNTVTFGGLHRLCLVVEEWMEINRQIGG